MEFSKKRSYGGVWLGCFVGVGFRRVALLAFRAFVVRGFVWLFGVWGWGCVVWCGLVGGCGVVLLVLLVCVVVCSVGVVVVCCVV